MRSTLLAIVPCLLMAGCHRPASVSFDVAAIHRDPGGKVEVWTTVGPSQAGVSSVVEVVDSQGNKAAVQVKEIGRNEATFDIIYPDGTTQETNLRRGESRDFFPKGQDSGVRIRLDSTSP